MPMPPKSIFLIPAASFERIFFVDLYTTDLGEKIETMFREMIMGPGAYARKKG